MSRDDADRTSHVLVTFPKMQAGGQGAGLSFRRFQLRTDLALGGMADAEQLVFDDAFVLAGNGVIFKVFDWANEFEGIADESCGVAHRLADSPYLLGPELLVNPGFETTGGGDPDFFDTWEEMAGDGEIAATTTGGEFRTGTAAKLTAGANDLGSLLTVAVGMGGTGYAQGDVLAVVQDGGADGTVRAESVAEETGAILTVSVLSPGCGYSMADGLEVTGGAGTDATIDILTIGGTKVAQTVTVEAATKYRLTIWTRGDATNGGRFGVYDVTHSAHIRAKRATGIKSETYASILYTFTTPAECTSLRVDLWCPATEGGIAYFDDISLISVTPLWSILRMTCLGFVGCCPPPPET